MAKIFQLRTKKKFNSKIDKGFTFNCPSKWTDHPSDAEVKAALEAIAGPGAGVFAMSCDCEILC